MRLSGIKLGGGMFVGGGARGGGGSDIIGGRVLSTTLSVLEGTRERGASSMMEEIADSIDCLRSEWEVRGRMPNVAFDSRKMADGVGAGTGVGMTTDANALIVPAAVDAAAGAMNWNCWPPELRYTLLCEAPLGGMKTGTGVGVGVMNGTGGGGGTHSSV
jgi:hypothetical protein